MAASRAGGNRVPRPALWDLLDAATDGPVTVVAGSAGSGKTVLVRSWLEQRTPGRPAAWVGVARGERDPQHFWNDVLGALAATGDPAMAAGPLAPTPDFDGDALAVRLSGQLSALAEPIVLVIDDLHEIASADILRQLTAFLERLPDAVHVVLVSRRDPQLGLHRRRLEGELTEIRNAQLQFTMDETRQMLSTLGVTLADDAVAQLHDRTEGWVAGIRLAAVSLATHPDPDRFVAEFSGSERTVAEYLLAEVLSSQPPEVRRLLLRASILGRVNGELGDLLTGDEDTERHLRALADAGAFVVALDYEGSWFRFHQLFSDLLAVELRHTEAAEVPRLHLLASRWHAEHGDVIEAIAHAQAAGDHTEAAGLLIDHYFSLQFDGRQATAVALLEAYAPDSADTPPEITAVQANDALTRGSIESAAAYLALAELGIDRVPEARRQRFRLGLLVTRLSLARRIGDFGSVFDDLASFEELIDPRDARDITINNDARTLQLLELGIVESWSGRLDDGARHLEEAAELARRVGRPYLEVAARSYWALTQSSRSLKAAGDVARAAVALAAEHGWEAEPIVAPALVMLGAWQIQIGRLEEGEQWLARAEACVRPDVEPAVGFVFHMASGSAHAARGRHPESLASYRNAERLGLRLVPGSILAAQYRGAVLSALLGSGEIAAVRDALGTMSDAERSSIDVRGVVAAVALADGDVDGAASALAQSSTADGHALHPLVVVRSLLLEALVRDGLGEGPESEAAVERALELAEHDTLILPFMFSDTRPLIERHPRHRTAHGAFLEEILDAVSGADRRPDAPTGPGLVDPLSEAELRVLRFLPTNLTAGGIASETYVSANTVKTHMRHIYAKLDVHNREEAVDRARQLGLLGHSARRDPAFTQNG